ncbi:VTT domain-containing protein [Acinetobacter sp. ME22]|uniref:VTT domain-containing protein n=1 Tax=Acinetobacter sp. ME22 TaxID=2904802 RepID=UPI001EDC5A26|nr:VTT domain-containing protein [Acinetobacter sp. ME22]MCG2574966.1 VTT domain-containing protein [Acinetobacter sp. ME22]
MHILDFLFSLEQQLPLILQEYGLWIYAIVFIIIFLETGCIAMFFLPGDSLLIALGALCASAGSVHLEYMFILLFLSAALGYIVNYYTGLYLGTKILNCRFGCIKQEYLDKTNHFFQKHGGKTIIFARFVPLIRSFAPFAAGSGGMRYSYFIVYNLIGAMLWIGVMLGIGYVCATTLWIIFQ